MVCEDRSPETFEACHDRFNANASYYTYIYIYIYRYVYCNHGDSTVCGTQMIRNTKYIHISLKQLTDPVCAEGANIRA